MSTSPPLGSERVQAAKRATYVAFIATGFAFANWASRIPQVRDNFALNPSQLGLILLSIAAGSIVALPIAGLLIHRFNTRQVVTAMSLQAALALTIIGLGYLWCIPAIAAGLFVFGFSFGAWDVSMNVQGAAVERRLGFDIMSRFHAGFSVGTVVGACIGTIAVFFDVPVSLHLIAIAVIIATWVPVQVRGFLPDAHDDDEPSTAAERHPLAAWKDSRTLLIGLFVLTFSFGEGTANDWISVAFIDGYGVSDAVGTLGFTAFLVAMTASRWCGPALLARYRRVTLLRSMAGIAVVGVALFVFGSHPALAFVGVLLWGCGVSLGFPVGMSAGADDPKWAASRVSVISSIGYCGFLAGPPLVGFLGHEFSVLSAMTVVGVLLALAVLITNSVREPE